MKNMTLKEIAVACGGIYYGDDESYYKEVSSVVIDSRKVEKDCLFIAIRGARVDGHMFIPQTIRDGALCALSEKRIENASYPYILVTSCEQALKDIAEHFLPTIISFLCAVCVIYRICSTSLSPYGPDVFSYP